jgi:hypothetical protein
MVVMSEIIGKGRGPLTIYIDPSELAVRLCEANYCIERPTPNADAALANMDKECREAWLRSARAAAEYFAELINERGRPQ